MDARFALGLLVGIIVAAVAISGALLVVSRSSGFEAEEAELRSLHEAAYADEAAR